MFILKCIRCAIALCLKHVQTLTFKILLKNANNNLRLQQVSLFPGGGYHLHVDSCWLMGVLVDEGWSGSGSFLNETTMKFAASIPSFCGHFPCSMPWCFIAFYPQNFFQNGTQSSCTLRQLYWLKCMEYFKYFVISTVITASSPGVNSTSKTHFFTDP